MFWSLFETQSIVAENGGCRGDYSRQCDRAWVVSVLDARAYAACLTAYDFIILCNYFFGF